MLSETSTSPRRADASGGERIRDAERSRAAILAAAEQLFAKRGFEGVGIGEIAAEAGLSRGTPSYFFGSKEQLYLAVLERVFADREEATRRACEPLVAWARTKSPHPIERALSDAVSRYMEFLRRRPSFAALIQREELASARGLRETPRDSRAIAEAFAAIRDVAPARGLRKFDVTDAVLVLVSLTFFPIGQRSTLMATLGRDLDDREAWKHHVELVVDQLLHLLGATRTG